MPKFDKPFNWGAFASKKSGKAKNKKGGGKAKGNAWQNYVSGGKRR
jgi:hypothetical protein